MSAAPFEGFWSESQWFGHYPDVLPWCARCSKTSVPLGLGMRCDAFEPGQHPRLREVWFTRSCLNFLSQEVSFEGLQDHVLGRRKGTWLTALSWHHNLGVSTICTLRACQFCLRSLQLGFETEEFTVWSFQFISHYAQISLDPFILPQTLRCSPWFCWFGVWSRFSSVNVLSLRV